MKNTLLFIIGMFVFGFSLQAQNWDEIIKVAASDRAAEDYFGNSVAVSGDYAVVGTPFEDEDASGGNTMNDAGSAYIFYNNAGTWEEVQKITASDRAVDDWFGSSVAISGDYVVVGAYYEDEDASGGNTMEMAGSVYIFYNNSGTWEEVQKITASDRAAGDLFGVSVAVSGDYAVVGAVCESEDVSGGNTLNWAGSAYIFYNTGSTWEEVQKIVASDRAVDDWFGYSVAVSGDYILVGVLYEDEDASGGNTMSNAGSAYIFYNDTGTWEEVQKITASDRAVDDWFGVSVSVSGDYAVVGACHESEDASGGNTINWAGSAYIFYNNSGTWEQLQKIVASDRAAEDFFGSSVAVSGDFAVVGAVYENEDASGGNTMSDAGSAYIFYNIGSTWDEVQKITASDRAVDDWFGYSVAVSGEYAVVAAPKEDEDASGGNFLDGAGSVYIFSNAAGNLLKHIVNSSEVLLFPNPTRGTINIKYINSCIQKITISDLIGKTLIEKTEIQQNETIDLSNFETGIYIICIQTDKEIFTTKIVKE